MYIFFNFFMSITFLSFFQNYYLKKGATDIRSQHNRLMMKLAPTHSVPKHLKNAGMSFDEYERCIRSSLFSKGKLEPSLTLKVLSMCHMRSQDQTDKDHVKEMVHTTFSDLSLSSPEMAGLFPDEAEIPAFADEDCPVSQTKFVDEWLAHFKANGSDAMDVHVGACEKDVLSQVSALFGFVGLRESQNWPMWALVFVLSLYPYPSKDLKKPKYISRVVPASWMADLRKRTALFLLNGNFFSFS